MSAKNDGNAAKRSSRASARGSTKADRQNEVTRAAWEVFAVKGYSAASIQDVAERVGVLKGSLYYYIDAKEDLLWRIVEEVHAQSTKILDRALALDLEPIERIRIYIRSHVEWYLNNVTQVGVFFREWRHLSDERLSITRSRRRGYEQIIRDLICAAQEHGDISPQLDVKYATLYVLAAVNAVPDWYRPAGKDSAARIADAFAAMTLGVLTGTPRPAGTLPTSVRWR